MNYNKIYDQLIIKVKNENRIKNTGIYYEKHHIIPDFMFKNRKRKGPAGHLDGNSNDKNNLILLTAKEHFIAHVLLYKIHKNTHYEFSCGSSLQFFFTKVINSHPRFNNYFNARKYEYYRLIGLSSISKARKDKMPVKNSITGEIIGSHAKNHPNILNGIWIHTSKNRKNTDEQTVAQKERSKGNLNKNYKNVSEEDLFKFVPLSLEDGYFKKVKFLEVYNKDRSGRNKISQQYIMNHYGSFTDFINVYNNKNSDNIIYDPLYRSSIQKNKARESSRQYVWVNKDNVSKRINKNEIDIYYSMGYVRGR